MEGEAIFSISNGALSLSPYPDPTPPPPKKKRNLPGTPDPDAEVIALSPKTLMATNRFLCEICGKGFQRDQNLQLHRRGHNLPWKLKQRSSKEPRKRVYVCPEKSCAHHHPLRALGDLTGIKKHFCRKHGEKKWKCDRCSRKYAVQSDWKAHSKTCGTREYRCGCGIIFSRRDSFITHRAFCDALAEETARISAASSIHSLASFNNLNSHPFPASDLMWPNMLPAPFKLADSQLHDQPIPGLSLWTGHGPHQIGPMAVSALSSDQLASLSNAQQLECQLNRLYGNKIPSPSSGELTSTSSAKEVNSSDSLLESIPSLFSSQDQHCHHHPLSAAPDMSATALLQKAAQIGAASYSHSQDSSKFDGLFINSSNPSLSFGLQERSIGHFALSSSLAMCSAPHQITSETRDFLGVGAQTICTSSINGWI